MSNLDPRSESEQTDARKRFVAPSWARRRANRKIGFFNFFEIIFPYHPLMRIGRKFKSASLCPSHARIVLALILPANSIFLSRILHNFAVGVVWRKLGPSRIFLTFHWSIFENFASWGTYRPNWTSRTLYRVPVTRQLSDIDAALIGPLSVTFYLLSNFWYFWHFDIFWRQD